METPRPPATPRRLWPPPHWGTPPPYDDEGTLVLWVLTKMNEDDRRAGIVRKQAPRPPAPPEEPPAS